MLLRVALAAVVVGAGVSACPASCPTFFPDSCAGTITLSPSASLTYSCGGTSCRTGGTVDDATSWFTSNPGGDLAACPYWGKTLQDPESIVQFEVAFSGMYSVEALPGPTPSPGLDLIMQLRTCTNVTLACDDSSGSNLNYPLALQYLFAGIQYVVIVEKKQGTSVVPNFLLRFTRQASGSSGCPVSCPTTSTIFNNGICDKTCASDNCQRDNGACAPVPTACPVFCPTSYVGDNICDTVCNVADCLYDRGDCPTAAPAACPSGCPALYRGDGYCDTVCNYASCNYDDGDCVATTPTAYPGAASPTYCPTSCPTSMQGNGVCEAVCNSYYCGYDGGDCYGYNPYNNGLYTTTIILSLIPLFVFGGIYFIIFIVVIVYHNNGNDLRACGVLWFGRPRHLRAGSVAGGVVLRPVASNQYNPQYASSTPVPQQQHVMVVQPHVMQVQAYIPTAQSVPAPNAGAGLYPSAANPQYVPTAKVADEPPL